MTTLGDVLTPDTEVAVVPRPRVWPRALAGFLIGFVLCLVAAAGALLAWDSQHDGRVLEGVSVGAVEISGMDRAAAAAAIHEAYDGYADGRVVIRTSAGDVAVGYEEFTRRADVDAMVDAALMTGRAGSPVERAVTEVRMAMTGVSLEPRVTLDEAALVERVTAVVAALDRRPVDSRISLGPDGIVRTLARPGRTFDGAGAAAAALEIVRRVDAPAEVVVGAVASPIPPEHDDAEALAAQEAAERMIGRVVVAHGDKEWKIKAATVRSWLTFETRADGSAWPVADQTAIEASLKKVAKGVQRDPVSAKYLKTRGGKVVGVVAAKNGRKLDKPATAAAIAQALDDRARGSEAVPVKAQTEKIPPKLTTAKALEKGPLMQRLGSWRTWFPISDRNYWGANIWLPAKIIDGTVLYPGRRFEWWSALGPVTPARGYGPGGYIAGDHTDPTGALGGGMCSSSTTLFNAALRAGLQMGARSNHKYYINRYPLGLDATVSKSRSGTQTVTFTNDMDHPIVIRTFRYRSGGRGWVRYEIWGIPDGRKVSISKATVWNVRKAVTRTEYVSTLRRGVREQVEYPANGMDVSVTRVVRSKGGRVLHRDTYRTHYTLWNGLVQIGR